MKKILFPILVVLSISAIAQTYTFNKVITSELSGGGKVISTSQKMINSDNSNYTLFLISNNIAEIFDRISYNRHIFNISYQVNDKISLEYVRSCDESENFKNLEIEKWDYRIEKVNNNEFILGKYKTKEAKKPKFETRIKIEESENDELNILHQIEKEFLEQLSVLLDGNKNYKIKEMNFFINGSKGKDLKLIEKYDYNLNVILPKKMNYKCVNDIPKLVKSQL